MDTITIMTLTTIKSKGNSMTTAMTNVMTNVKTNVKTNTTTSYGLKASTVSLYSKAVKMGYSWSLAMSELKELYEHNASIASNKVIATTEFTECGL